jgi:hypothetical protein
VKGDPWPLAQWTAKLDLTAVPAHPKEGHFHPLVVPFRLAAAQIHSVAAPARSNAFEFRSNAFEFRWNSFEFRSNAFEFCSNAFEFRSNSIEFQAIWNEAWQKNLIRINKIHSGLPWCSLSLLSGQRNGKSD